MIFSVEPQVLADEQTSPEGFVTGRVSLVCRADGVPLPEISWLKDGCPLSRAVRELSRFHVTQRLIPGFRSHIPEAVESVLMIDDSVESDSGAYSCRATNELNAAYLPNPHQVKINSKMILKLGLHYTMTLTIYSCPSSSGHLQFSSSIPVSEWRKVSEQRELFQLCVPRWLDWTSL